MITLTVANKLETQQLTHNSGPLELGRGPARSGSARVVVRDAFVSRDHIHIEELPGRKVKVLNLSTKAPITVDNHAVLNPGAECDYLLPVRLAVGETVVDVDSGDSEPVSVNVLKTIAAPARAGSGTQPALIDRSEAAKPEEIVGWLETVVNVQKAGERDAFYKQAADALVSHIGLDTGIVLLKERDAWRVVAQVVKDDNQPARAFSHALLAQALTGKRTFYVGAAAAGGGESLVGVQGVVVSPFFDSRDNVIGVIYGNRMQRARGREIGPLEAQVVQLLATAVGAGLQRLEQDDEANRLRVAKDAAEEADRTKSGFLAMVSHELRTPLTTIIGYSEMLLEQAAMDNLPQYTADLQQVHSAGQHLLALINDILDFSKIEAGKLEIANDPYAPASLIGDLILSVEPLAKKNNNRIEVDCPPDLGRAMGDPTRIRQCVLNLVGNACKFTKDGTVTVTARREPVAGVDSVRVSVSDTGIGMSPEQIGRLFQAFTQVDSSAGRKFGGTGLGLAISQKLCAAMGGQITVASELGKGSTFTMTIKAML
ncbi:histidine kinase : Histidine kinase OS=Beggiatoa alba B18LD GN=BegalDRAFT_3109 PE=4 SV=1: HisKA: HATPase_c [Gemmata massiliana]|uniref:histidine kinase n=1 Tax=Gemmata massiliana TaxID=1210884 RepID=A0A6P2CSC3_9BACT|nr:ATP-binding protein [Gemmata massiliana]VTR91821.1 histidine kinase : Histidine kinase OS=Beggiatoa alba B18LD GN=BegalDRAFT_3109 PE=4 SV=1: HisKA: HATPase_c [Gemmata massiliana]